MVKLNLLGCEFYNYRGTICRSTANHSSPLLSYTESTILSELLEQPNNGRQESQLFKANLKNYKAKITCYWCSHQQEVLLHDPKDLHLCLHKLIWAHSNKTKLSNKNSFLQASHTTAWCLVNTYSTLPRSGSVGACFWMPSTEKETFDDTAFNQTLLPACTSIDL